MPFEASQAIFRSLFSQKESKLSSTGLAFVPDAKLQLSTFRYAQKAKFRDFFEKVSLPFRLLPFASYPPRFFCKTLEDREIFLKEVPVGSWTRFLLEFSGQSYTVFCVFLWSV